jgi:hypothetical protein
VAAIVVLLLGAGVAVGVGEGLGLSFTPSATPPPIRSSVEAAPVSAVPSIARIALDGGERVALAATAVADALVARGAPAPAAAAGLPDPDLVVRIAGPVGDSAEAYRIRGGADAGHVLEAGDPAGAAAGLYAIADRIRSGAPVVTPQTDGIVQAPRLGLRLTEVGSVGREADPAAFATGTDYSLNTDIVAGAVLPSAPWVDAAAVARIDGQFRQFVRHALRHGYNGVVVPGFLEYVSFRGVGDGQAVYPAGDPHIARAEAMAAAFAPVFRYADEMGLRVFFLTDMLAVSPPLEAYLEREFGGLAVDDPALWSVYQAGLGELFERMPFADGLMVRVGEGGEVYQAGWDYSSRLAVTTETSVRAMLRALLRTVAEHDRELIFRTWTVGVGAVGDLHTSPEAYATVLGDIADPRLIVSTKYVAGDFYSHLPLNPTLSVGEHRRIVEFQARREFEGFGALPNNLVAEHQQALQHFLAANPRVEGVWNWTQDGGPLRAGPMTLYLREGFWQQYDLNTYGTARLAWDPSTPPGQITADWVRQTLSDDPATAAAITEALGRSREAITKGLYIGPYARQTVRALGLEPPPMMWIFEWDIVTGDSAALDSIYAVSRNDLDEAIAEGRRAADVAEGMRALVAATDADAWRSAFVRESFVDALTYETDLLRTLAAYRAMVLRHAQWLDTGDRVAYDQWQRASSAYRDARASHVARYGGRVDLPAYNFTAADLGSARADRDPAMAWLARGLLALVAVALLLGALRRPRVPGAAALRALFVAATRPWRLGAVPVPAGRLDRVLVWLLPLGALVLSRAVYTWFAAPAHLLMTLGGWLLFAAVLRWGVIRRADPFHLWAALGGVALLRTVILLVALAARGPGRYWLLFWTAPESRHVYITVAFGAFCWLFVVVTVVLRGAYGRSTRRAVGPTALAAGGTLALLAGVVAATGLERALTIWNDQMALLPWGLSRILGITVHLGIPPSLPTVALVAGLAVALVGAALSLRPARRRPAADGGQVGAEPLDRVGAS